MEINIWFYVLTIDTLYLFFNLHLSLSLYYSLSVAWTTSFILAEEGAALHANQALPQYIVFRCLVDRMQEQGVHHYNGDLILLSNHRLGCSWTQLYCFVCKTTEPVCALWQGYLYQICANENVNFLGGKQDSSHLHIPVFLHVHNLMQMSVELRLIH